MRNEIRGGLRREQLDEILGTPRRAQAGRTQTPTRRQSGQPVLALYARRPKKLMATFKGKKFTATVRKDGAIRFRGSTGVGHNINGWWFWKYEKSRGNWVRLRELRTGR